MTSHRTPHRPTAWSPIAAARTLAVRRAVADDDLTARARGRLAILRRDAEAGAETVEYALLGGVSVALLGGIVTFLRNSDVIEAIVRAVIALLIKVIEMWQP